MARKRKQASAAAEAAEVPSGDETADIEGGATDVLAVSTEDAKLGDAGSDADGMATGDENATGDGAAEMPADAIVRDAAVASVNGQHVDVSDSAVVSIAAGSVEANDTLILVGAVGKLSGNARVLVDPRAALVFGAVAGLVIAVFGALLHGGGDAEE